MQREKERQKSKIKYIGKRYSRTIIFEYITKDKKKR